jgi:hypothetical protein
LHSVEPGPPEPPTDDVVLGDQSADHWPHHRAAVRDERGVEPVQDLAVAGTVHARSGAHQRHRTQQFGVGQRGGPHDETAERVPQDVGRPAALDLGEDREQVACVASNRVHIDAVRCRRRVVTAVVEGKGAVAGPGQRRHERQEVLLRADQTGAQHDRHTDVHIDGGGDTDRRYRAACGTEDERADRNLRRHMRAAYYTGYDVVWGDHLFTVGADPYGYLLTSHLLPF